MISIVNSPLIANESHLFKLSVLNVPLKDIFQVFNTFINTTVKKYACFMQTNVFYYYCSNPNQ